VHKRDHTTTMQQWLAEVAQKLQSAVGGTLTGELDDMRRACEQAISTIPTPRTPIEKLVLRGLLLEFASRCAYEMHARSHRASDPMGALGEQASILRAFVRSSDDPLKGFLGWVQLFFRDVARAHPRAAARRIAESLDVKYRQPLNVAALARQAHLSNSQLQRAFRKEFGLTLRDYQGRLRVLASLAEVMDTKSEATALLVGYKSRKNFYVRFRKVTGLTPTGFRRLPDVLRQEIVNRVRESLKRDDHRRISA